MELTVIDSLAKRAEKWTPLISVTLKETNLVPGKLTLTVIDSQADTAESTIEVPVLNNGTLQIGGKKDQLCLGHTICYFLIL